MITTKIRAAVELLENGDRAYAAGDICTAELLHERADDSYTSIVRDIGRSTEQEAELLEPLFTDFEAKLLKFGAAVGRIKGRNLRSRHAPVGRKGLIKVPS